MLTYAAGMLEQAFRVCLILCFHSLGTGWSHVEVAEVLELILPHVNMHQC